MIASFFKQLWELRSDFRAPYTSQRTMMATVPFGAPGSASLPVAQVSAGHRSMLPEPRTPRKRKTFLDSASLSIPKGHCENKYKPFTIKCSSSCGPLFEPCGMADLQLVPQAAPPTTPSRSQGLSLNYSPADGWCKWHRWKLWDSFRRQALMRASWGTPSQDFHQRGLSIITCTTDLKKCSWTYDVPRHCI